MGLVSLYYMHTFFLNVFSKRGEKEGKEKRGGKTEEGRKGEEGGKGRRE